MELKHTAASPLSEGMYLTDGGLETTLIFHYGFELNHFAAFELLGHAAGRKALARYYLSYLEIARKRSVNFVMETPTWRASKDWGYLLGYNEEEMVQVNRDAIEFVRKVGEDNAGLKEDVVLSGNIGPRGDGYVASGKMQVVEAKEYHQPQIEAFANAGADMVSALTMNYIEEAVGIVLAAQHAGLPVAISFTVETDGRLPAGDSLQKAIEKTDLLTNGYAAYYMLNCAHPDHFKHIIASGGNWLNRIKGLRANASTKSHEELDACETLDTGDKQLLAGGYAEVLEMLPGIQVIGGCCGTDHSHLEAICERVLV